jgi:hypothetical protein
MKFLYLSLPFQGSIRPGIFIRYSSMMKAMTRLMVTCTTTWASVLRKEPSLSSALISVRNPLLEHLLPLTSFPDVSAVLPVERFDQIGAFFDGVLLPTHKDQARL